LEPPRAAQSVRLLVELLPLHGWVLVSVLWLALE
jgi:hypothetical protein